MHHKNKSHVLISQPDGTSSASELVHLMVIYESYFIYIIQYYYFLLLLPLFFVDSIVVTHSFIYSEISNPSFIPLVCLSVLQSVCPCIQQLRPVAAHAKWSHWWRSSEAWIKLNQLHVYKSKVSVCREHWTSFHRSSQVWCFQWMQLSTMAKYIIILTNSSRSLKVSFLRRSLLFAYYELCLHFTFCRSKTMFSD